MTKTNYKILNDCRGMYEDEVFDIILNQRGIENVEHFLNPTEEDLLPLGSLKRVNEAYIRINKAIEDCENIAILADTDTDGITSGAIITRYLRNFTPNIETYIDSGKQHGLVGQNLSQFDNADLVIIVDSLDSTDKQYRILHDNGKDVIVLDHHAIDSNVPYDDVCILVSSQREYKNTQLSGAGVVWKVCKYIDEQYLTDYADSLVDLAACGILADVCGVSEQDTENRYIVSKGLDNLVTLPLKKIIGSYEFNSKAILFSIAPLINASCRTFNNRTALDMFLSDDSKEVLRLKKILEKAKEEQKEEIDKIFPDICKEFESQDRNVLYAITDTKFGINGLIGNKCLEKYNKPLFILKDCGDTYSGSMRSVGYGDFRQLCNDTGLAVLNGHEQASGVTIKKSDFNKFIETIDKKLSKIEQTSNDEVDVDCLITIDDLTRKLVELSKKVNRISGSGFQPIKFKIVDIEDYQIGNFKQGKHLVITTKDYIQLIQWNTTADFDELKDDAMFNEPIEVIGELDSGFFIRKFMLKVIIDDYKVGENLGKIH